LSVTAARTFWPYRNDMAKTSNAAKTISAALLERTTLSIDGRRMRSHRHAPLLRES